MTWAPNPNEPAANFEGPIIDNTLDIIERDFKGALDYYYPGEKLPDFQERALGQVQRKEFPCLAISPRNTPTDESDDRANLAIAARLDIYIGVTADNANNVTRLIMKYVQTMDAILRTARRDFFTGMNNPFGVVLDVTHVYGPLGGPSETVYFRGALVELTVSLRQGKG